MERWAAAKAHGQPNGAVQQWTATRCHRLLRPLLAHVAALRKEVSWQRNSHSETGPTQEDTTLDEVVVTGKRLLRDGDPFVPRKKARYTYSLKVPKVADRQAIGRNCQIEKAPVPRAQHEEPSKEGIVLPTPVVKRVRGHQTSSPVSNIQSLPEDGALAARSGRCNHARDCSANRCIFEIELAALRKTTAPSCFSMYESTYRALDALLRATSAQKGASNSSKSLLSMCLRQVPGYITEVEYWKRKDAEACGALSALDGSEVSFEIYSELESLGTGTCGWEHLATVVRAHGIKIIKEAIAEGLIGYDFSVLLARLCNESHCFPDRGELVEAIVCQQYPKPSGPDDWFARSRETMPLELFLPSSRETWVQPYRARTMAQLLDRRLLPWEWILTRDFGTIWSWTVRDLAQKNTDQDSMDFIITSIRVLCSHTFSTGRRGASSSKGTMMPSQQALISALAALVAMAILGQQTLLRDPAESARDRIMTINKRVEYILRKCLNDASETRSGGIRPGTYVLLLASFFFDTSARPLEADNSRHEACLRECWARWADGHGSSRSKQQYEATRSLACSLAHSCGRGATEPAHIYLDKLCDELETAGNPSKRVRQEAAFCLAEQTGDLRDLAFAESLGGESGTGASDTTDNARRNPGRKTAFAGFQWDEGISEWVTAGSAAIPAWKAVKTPTDEPATKTPRNPTSPPRTGVPSRLHEADTRPAPCSTGGGQLPGKEAYAGGRTSCGGEIRKEGRLEELARRADPPNPRVEPRRQGTDVGVKSLASNGFRIAGGGDDDSDDELWAGKAGREQENARPPRQRSRTSRKINACNNHGRLDDKGESHKNHGGGRATHRTIEWQAPARRKRARNPLHSRQPLRTISNVYGCDGSSDDELGV